MRLTLIITAVICTACTRLETTVVTPLPIEPPLGTAWTQELGARGRIDLVWVEGGEYQMGSTQTPAEVASQFGGEEAYYLDEHPRHAVRLDGFWAGRCEVTVAQFRSFVEASDYRTTAERQGWAFVFDGQAWQRKNGASWKSPGFRQADDHPVVCVSWHDARAYCDWLSARTGYLYTLPTEAEWEYAARAGTTDVFAWGGAPAGGEGRANACDATAAKAFPGRSAFEWDDGYAHTAPVGSFGPNAFGLFDMTGNVWEWTADWYGEDAYANHEAVNPAGPAEGEHRVLRGGGWPNDAGGCRVADRNAWPAPGDCYAAYGFRVVMRPE